MAHGIDHRIRLLGIDDEWEGKVRLTLIDDTSENREIELGSFELELSDANRGHELVAALRGEVQRDQPYTAADLQRFQDEVRSWRLHQGAYYISLATGISWNRLSSAIRRLEDQSLFSYQRMTCTCGHDYFTHRAINDPSKPAGVTDCVRVGCQCEQFEEEGRKDHQ